MSLHKSPQFLVSVVRLLVLFTFVNPLAHASTITTFAGGGPDNMPALLANLQKPIGVVSGHFGIYYVSAGNRVYEINRNNDPPNVRAIAGTGFAGYSGDGGPALQATLNQPDKIALDGHILYVAEPLNFVVRRINLSTKIIDTFAGNGTFGLPNSGLPPNQTSLMHPTSLAVDIRHIVYIGDETANKVYAVSQTISLFAGRGTPTIPGTGGGIGDGGDPKFAGLSVQGLAVTGMVLTTVYISDPINHRIRVVYPDNKIDSYAGGAAGGSCSYPGPSSPIPVDSICLKNPVGIAATPSNELFITDSEFQKIWKVNGNKTAFVADYTPGTPTAITTNPNGEILFASYGDNKIYSLDPDTYVKTEVAGNGLETFNKATQPLSAVSFLAPTDLVYNAGALYVADGGNYIVRKIDLTSNSPSISDVVGDRTKVGANSVGPVTGLAVDSIGNLYLAASTDHIIFRVTQAGVLIPFAGKRNTPDNHHVFNGYAPFGLLTSPWGIAVDKNNNLLIAETGDRLIRKVFYADGRMEFLSGFYDSPYYTSPRGIAFPPTVDPAAPDKIFVNDGYQIKFFTGFGQPTVFAGKGGAGSSGNGGPAKDAEFNDINAVIFDGRGGILLSDSNNNQVRRIDLATNMVNVFAGTGVRGFSGDGGDPKNAQLNHPLGLAIDRDGTVYISDSGNGRIRKVTP